MSNLVDHAKRELDLLGMHEGSDPYNDMMRKAILDIITMFSEQGHSGFSAHYATDAVAKLMRFENLSPLTDDPNDWIEVGQDMWQCRRRSDAFSMNGGKTFYSVNEHTGDLETTPTYPTEKSEK